MFGDNSKLAGNLSVDLLREEMKQQKDVMREYWRLYEELRKKVNGLYTKDIHDTERPKVDILSDTIDNEILYEIIELRNKIVDLEKKK